MADGKGDLRVTRTRAALRSAFEELIAETTLDKITVKALTERAGVNRRTFYLHYDALESFYDDIMNGIMDEFFAHHEKTPDDPWDMDGHARRFFRFLAAQPPMIEQLVCSPNFYDFGGRIYAAQMEPDDPWDMDGHARRFFRFLAAQPPMIEQLVCSPNFYDFGGRIYAAQMERYRAKAGEGFWRYAMTPEQEELVCALIRNIALDFYRQWVRRGKPMAAEDAARLIGSVTLHGTEHLLTPRP